MAYIDGEITLIDSKTEKMRVFSLHSRKNSAYLFRNDPHPISNRKKSAYFILLFTQLNTVSPRVPVLVVFPLKRKTHQSLASFPFL